MRPLAGCEENHDHVADCLAHVVGQENEFRKTVSESDVYLFAGITGDLSESHVDQQAMQGTEFGERIAHGMLVLSFMSTGSTWLIELTRLHEPRMTSPQTAHR